jgi:histone deacetylase 1/2
MIILFPGSGNIREVGMGKGKHYAFNVPLMDGVTDEQYTQAFDRYMDDAQP